MTPPEAGTRASIKKCFDDHYVDRSKPTKLGEWGYHIPSVIDDLETLLNSALIKELENLLEAEKMYFINPTDGVRAVALTIIQERIKQLKANSST